MSMVVRMTVNIIRMTLLSLFLVACANGEKVVKQIENDTVTLDDYQAAAEVGLKKREVVRFEKTDEIYLGFGDVDNLHGDPLPESWTTSTQPLTFGAAVELEFVAAQLRSLLKVPVVIEDTFPNMQFNESGSAQAVRREQTKSQPIIEEPIDINSGSFIQENTADPLSPIPGPLTVSANGTWEQILDHIANTFQVDWAYENNTLKFKYYKSDVFKIENVAGFINNDNSISQAGGGDVGVDITSSTRQTTSATLEIDLWDSLSRSLAAILPDDSRIVSTPALQTITVTAPAYIFDRVVEFFEGENDRLSRQIALHLDVYSVTITDRQRQSFGVDLAFRDLQDRFGFEFNGIGPGFEDPNSSILSASIISPPAGSTFAQFGGSQIVGEALKRNGKVVSVYENQKIVSNLIPTNFQLTNQRSYICRRELGALGQGDQITSAAEPCTVSSGFRMNLLPNIHDDGRISLRASISITELVGIERLGSENTLLELPELNIGDLFGQAYVASGDMMILTGFEQRINRITEESGGNIVCTLFCSADDFDGETRKLYFVLRPILLRKPKPIRIGAR